MKNMPLALLSLAICLPAGAMVRGADDAAAAIVSRDYVAGELPTSACHASTIAETKPGEFIAAWFGGTRESHVDVGIWVSRFEHGRWSAATTVPWSMSFGLVSRRSTPVAM